ncbi:MAG: SpoIIE family protein phosphatase [Firmicutes bacterium]|nr:SpoIIE family protein phosphatase [Bacillota bacterium]
MQRGRQKRDLALVSAQGVVLRQAPRLRGHQTVIAQTIAGLIACLILALLLGRAHLVGALSPFALPFVVLLQQTRPKWAPFAMLACVVGAATETAAQAFMVAASILFYLSLSWLLFGRSSAPLRRAVLLVVPAIALASALVGVWEGAGLWVILLFAAIGALSSLAVHYLFMETLPIFGPRNRRALRDEEIICLSILAATACSGLAGVTLHGVRLALVAAGALTVLFARAGGAAAAAPVGAISGVLLVVVGGASPGDIALLAFGGVLGGLLAPLKRVGPALGFALGGGLLALFAVYPQNPSAVLWEVGVAAAASIALPRALVEALGQLLPQTQAHAHLEQDHLTRMRMATALQIREAATLFRELAEALRGGVAAAVEPQTQVAEWVGMASDRVCSHCRFYHRCWEEHYARTYHDFQEAVAAVEQGGREAPLPEALRRYCIAPEQVRQAIAENVTVGVQQLALNEQLQEARQLVATQLGGAADVVEEISRQLDRPESAWASREEQLRTRLDAIGMAVYDITLHSITPARVDLTVTVPAYPGYERDGRLIGEVCSAFFGEPMHATLQHTPSSLVARFRVRSAESLRLETAVASAGARGASVSGDSHAIVDVGDGRIVLALSDGMGHGEKAHAESRSALALLQRLLSLGFDVNHCVATINSILSLQGHAEMYTTLDLATVDLQSGMATLLKVGAAPSLVKRGREVILLSGEGLPVGILPQVIPHPTTFQLQEDDWLILFSDGLLQQREREQDPLQWAASLVAHAEAKTPQQLVDYLLQRALRVHGRRPADDITVLVAHVLCAQTTHARAS